MNAGEPPTGEESLEVALSAPERQVARALQGFPDEAIEEGELAERLGLPIEVVRGSLQRLRSKHLAVVEEESLERPRLTERGEAAVAAGLPERRLLEALRTAPGRHLEPAALAGLGLEGEERSAAIGVLRRRGLLAEGTPFRLKEGRAHDDRLPEEEALQAVAHGDVAEASVFAALKRRGLALVEHRSRKRWSLSEEGRQLTVPADDRPLTGALSGELLRSGGWRDETFRPYDVRAAVPYLSGPRPHPYTAWIREFEEILLGLGFAQFEGPLLETEFWNADALYMPQEHPARSIHDVLTLRDVRGRSPPLELLERVAAAHEGRALPCESEPLGAGWRYPYDRSIATRPVLRSQTMAVSARFLASRPEPPFRRYCIDRNFRSDAVDATHHVEFQQCEGVLGGEGVTIRHLIGVLSSLTQALGIRELKIRPSYFPFTEPSIEGYVRHPRLGWIEVFPGGMFRPEVLRPFGVRVPVAAWGIGVTRLAMVSLGVSDIRELFDYDLGRLTAGAPDVPRATLSIARIGRLLGRPIAREELTEPLFASKSQVEGGAGDALEVEGTADRLDLLTESGLALHLQGALGAALGRPPLHEVEAPARRIEVAPSVRSLRPAIAGVVVAPPSGSALDADLLEEAIRFQELLHATLGLDRRLASLGIYPLDRIVGPVRYALEPLESVRFVPLDGASELSGTEFYQRHPMAERYGRYGREGDACLTLRDAAGTVLSLPPVLDARPAGEASVGDRALLLESTGRRDSRVLDAVALLSLVFAARGWSLAPVEIALPPPQAPTASPIAVRRLHLSTRTLEELSGDRLEPSVVTMALRRARYDAEADATGWRVEAAPWRVDLHAPVDVAEDLLIARGYASEEGILPPSTVRGARSPSARFRARVSDLLLGLGYVPLYTPVLVAERLVSLSGRPRVLALANPVSEQFARMRDALSLGLLAALEHNVRHAYPQRFSEVGPVVVGAPDAESGAETRHHAGILLASETAGFADAASVVDYLMRSLGAVGVREPATLPGTIPGRAALVRLAGVVVAEVGEVAPAVLSDLRVPVPAVWAELDLTALERLLRPAAGSTPTA